MEYRVGYKYLIGFYGGQENTRIGDVTWTIDDAIITDCDPIMASIWQTISKAIAADIREHGHFTSVREIRVEPIYERID